MPKVRLITVNFFFRGEISEEKMAHRLMWYGCENAWRCINDECKEMWKPKEGDDPLKPNDNIVTASLRHWKQSADHGPLPARPHKTEQHRSSYMKEYMRKYNGGSKRAGVCEAIIWKKRRGGGRVLERCKAITTSRSKPRFCHETKHLATLVRPAVLGREAAMQYGGHDGLLVEVKESRIPEAGRGVFAKVDFNPGDIITEYPGVWYESLEEIPLACRDRLYRPSKNYPKWLAGLPEPVAGLGLGSFINSLNTEQQKTQSFNVKYSPSTMEGVKRVFAAATKAIKAGEELYASYNAPQLVPKNK